MSDEIYFLTRYTPFWAVPIFLLSMELVYLFWMRKKKKYMFFFVTVCCFCLFASSFYYWAGGPERSVAKVKEAKRFYTD